MRKLAVIIALCAAASAANAQIVTISDTAYFTGGLGATGSVQISWPAFVGGDGHFVPASSKIVVLGLGGIFSTTLEANDTMTPAGTLYVVQYRINGGPSPYPTEYWSCPSSVTPLTIPQCRTTSTAQPSGIVNISQLSPVGALGSCLQSTGTAWQANPSGDCWTLQGPGPPSANCTVGQTYFQTDATAGQNVWLCTSTNTWTQFVGSGGGSSASCATVSFSATPTFNGSSGTVKCFNITLTGNITSCTLASFTIGQIAMFNFLQDGTGSRTVACAGLTDLGTVSGQINKSDKQVFSATAANAATAYAPMWCPECSPAALLLPGSSSGFATVQAAAAAGGTQTVPATTGTFGIVVASGASALGTSAISSTACATVVSPSASGVVTTDRIEATFNGDPTAVTGYVPATAGGLTIFVYPTADHVNLKVCNSTSSSITPGAITINWSVVR